MLLMASVMQFQSTPPVWGATGTLHTQGRAGASISIHAPRVGGDMEKLKSKISNTISIHAPRVGGDSVRHFTLPGFHYFNPRPPCGGRQRRAASLKERRLFQSTPPVWGATPDNWL